MADAQSLLSLIARGYAAGREDAATEALCFILSHSESARDEFGRFLGDNGEPLPIACFRTQQLVNGAYPDMACFDDAGDHVAFVESKFWASLTSNQPVTYWKALPDDRPAVLLFLAPASRVARIDDGWLRAELVERLRLAGHDLTPADWQKRGDLVTATTQDGQRRLMLTSWDALLDRLAHRTEKDGDAQACFEVAELRGLAADAIKGEPTPPDHNLRRSFQDAVERLKQSGWADTDGLTVGTGTGYYARYFRLAGAPAGLRIDYEDKKQRPDRFLWLWFWQEEKAKLAVEDVADILRQAGESDLVWRGTKLLLPIVLSDDADDQATVNSLVAELERIARIIRPDGLTDRDDSTIE